MARALQTLVLTRERIAAPVFSSIEEYLGRNTQAYYDILAEVGAGSWNPHRNARPWIRFCLTAHYRQAMTHLQLALDVG
jgi:Fic family protein